MATAFIAIGSNIDPFMNVRLALIELGRLEKILALSTLWMTDPEGATEQPRFLNGVVKIETDRDPVELKYSVLRKIEDGLGRVRTADKYALRTIDLDVILYDDWIIESDEIVLPDPEIMKRRFLAVPLGELAPDMILPVADMRMSEIADGFAGHTMDPMDEYTRKLRNELGIE